MNQTCHREAGVGGEIAALTFELLLVSFCLLYKSNLKTFHLSQSESHLIHYIKIVSVGALTCATSSPRRPAAASRTEQGAAPVAD